MKFFLREDKFFDRQFAEVKEFDDELYLSDLIRFFKDDLEQYRDFADRYNDFYRMANVFYDTDDRDDQNIEYLKQAKKYKELRDKKMDELYQKLPKRIKNEFADKKSLFLKLTKKYYDMQRTGEIKKAIQHPEILALSSTNSGTQVSAKL